jgi:preprotein translocase subunit YajC
MISKDLLALAGMGDTSIWVVVIYMVGIIALMYFFLLRPNKKKKKQEDEMRNNLQIGDEITTIGGIMGRVVSIKDETDSLVIETGIDRSKVRIKRWAIASCDTVHDN